MSWIFAVISNKPFMEWEIERFASIHQKSHTTIINSTFYLAVGGLKQNTLIHYENYEQTAGWLVIGNGYLRKDTGYGLAEKNDWLRLMNKEYRREDIDGAYLLFRWDNGFVEAWNDVLGMHDLYFAKNQGYTILCSRLDWISDLLDKKQWNYAGFAALSYLNCFLKHESLLKNVERLGRKGYIRATIHRFVTEIKSYAFRDDLDADINKYLFYLHNAICFPVDSHNKILFSHQEDFCNRYQLALFLNKPKKLWSVLEPEYPNQKDQERFLKLEKTFYLPVESKPVKYDFDKMNAVVQDYFLSTLSTCLSDDLMLTDRLPILTENEITFFDSDFSHFYFDRFDDVASSSFIKGLEQGDIALLQKVFAMKSLWMNRDFSRFMLKGLQTHLMEYYGDLQYIPEMSIRDFIHQTNINSEAVHRAGKKMVWMSGHVGVYNPYLMASLIEFRQRLSLLPSLLRKNYLSILEQHFPELLFHLKFKEYKHSLTPDRTISEKMYRLLLPSIIDRLNETQVKQCPYYDYKKLTKLINKGNFKNDKVRAEIIRWYAFEIWRKQFEK